MHLPAGNGSGRRSTRAAVEESLDRLFNRSRCMTQGCDRQPAAGERLCGCCLEDRRAGREVIFRGGEMLPDCHELTKVIYGGPATYQWTKAVR